MRNALRPGAGSLLVLVALLFPCSAAAEVAGPVQGHALRGEAAPEGSMPTPPVALAGPVVEGGEPADPSLAQARFAAARQEALDGDVEAAIRDATSAVASGGRGEALLARLYARRGENAAAFYWLQRAALEEGLDPASVEHDGAYKVLRADPLWPAVAEFLLRAADYWAVHGSPRVVVVAPPGARDLRRLPVVIGLHETGDGPDDFVDRDLYADVARRLGVVVVGVSGPLPLGPTAYAWSRDPAQNARRIDAGLAEAGLDGARTQVLFGFGEGAQVALDTAAHDVNRYRGAIAMSPKGLGWHLDDLEPSEKLARQGYVVAFGSLESWDAVGTSYVDADYLKDAGARVRVHTAWLVTRHALPPDFATEFPAWVRFVLASPADPEGRPAATRSAPGAR